MTCKNFGNEFVMLKMLTKFTLQNKKEWIKVLLQ